MVDRGGSSRAESKHFAASAKSRKSSSASSEFDEEYRERLEGKYLGNGLEVRPPSGTHHQQPGSHLSIDTRLTELSLAHDHLVASEPAYSSQRTSASSKKSSPYQVLVDKPNCYITSPFKQGYHITNKTSSKVVDPSVQLKKVTQDSIDRVRQQFRRPKPPPRTSGYAPRLRKAKLKTTGRPISGSGPSIQQCRGIRGGVHFAARPTSTYYHHSDEPPYTRSPSIRPGSPSEIHRPDSSIHCTSRVQSEHDGDSCSDQTFSSSSDVIDSWQSRHDGKDDNDNNDNNGPCDHGKMNDPNSLSDPRRSSDQNEADLDRSLDQTEADLERSLDQTEEQKDLLLDDVEVQNETDFKDTSNAETFQHDLSNGSLGIHDSCCEKDLKNASNISNDNSEKKSKFDKKQTRDSTENCKPFNDTMNGLDNDDSEDDDELYKRTLPSSYNNYSHSSQLHVVNSNQDSNLTKSGSVSSDSNERNTNTNQSMIGKKNSLGTENKVKSENRTRDDKAMANTSMVESNHETISKTGLENKNKMNGEYQIGINKTNDIDADSFKLGPSCSTKLFTTLPQRNSVKNHKTNKDELLTDNHMHVVESTSNNGISPVMTVHVRGKIENDKNENNPNTKASDASKDHDSSLSDGDLVSYDDDDDDNDDEDNDRIPSAIIWQNLDQLNLSMNASPSNSSNRNDFRSKARKVQSAGSRRNANTEHSMADSTKNKPKSRTSSAKKRTKSKVKPQKEEECDKAELLRKYLSEESRKFSAELPGYFTEQFNIIQETKGIKVPKNKNCENTPDSKALVKYDGPDNQEEKDQCCNEDGKGKESSVYLIEVEDPSSAVFFTMDSTTNSTCDLESVSGQTDHTIEMGSDTREFSDDTGFETMPGSGLSGMKIGGSKIDSGTSMDTGATMNIGMNDDAENEQIRVPIDHEDLEVIAKAKHLTDPKSSCNPLYSACPYEPLRFSINARPPHGYLYYFAYGVDMNAKRMSLYLRREYKRMWGILFGFKLRFNKKGTSCDAGGFANVEFSPGNSVEGCVYTITDADLSMLDNCMGYPKHYCRVVLPVWMSNSHDPELHGVAQYCVPAVLYVVQQQWVEPGQTDFLDCSYSISQCLKASDILTPNYVEFLNHLVVG